MWWLVVGCGAPPTDANEVVEAEFTPTSTVCDDALALNGAVDLDSATWRMHGDPAHPSGGAVAAGDLDGDGHTDLVVSAPWGAPEGERYGEVYVFYGPLAAEDLGPEHADAVLRSDQTGDLWGLVLAVGDLDGEPGDELVISAYGHAVGQDYMRGRVAVYAQPVGALGPDDATTLVSGSEGIGYMGAFVDVADGQLLASTNQGVHRFDGPWTGTLGPQDATLTVAGAGFVSVPDVDGDGVADILVEDLGVVRLYGSAQDFQPRLSLTPALPTKSFGVDLGLGDVTGDGGHELVLTSWANCEEDGTIGTTWVVDAGLTGDLVVDDVASARLIESVAGVRTGMRLVVDDLDGDGVDDIVVGGPGAPTSALNPDGWGGALWMVRGPVDGEVHLDAADAVLAGPDGGYLGWAFAAVPDVDGDGSAELLVGHHQVEPTGARLFCGGL